MSLSSLIRDLPFVLRRQGYPTPARTLTAFEALRLASRQRVDFVMVGDNNQLRDNHGLDWGFTEALTARFGMFATPIYGSYVQGSYTGYGGSWSTAATSGAPSELAALVLPNHGYRHLTNVQSETANVGISINTASQFNVNANIRCHFNYGTYPGDSGTMQLRIRREESPWTQILLADEISTNAGAYGRQHGYFDLAAAARDYPLGFKWNALVGPVMCYDMRVEDLDLDHGVSVHTMLGNSGYSMYDCVDALDAYDTDAWGLYFGEMRRLQLAKGQSPRIVLCACFGYHDRSEPSVPSLGWRKSMNADSPEAFVDNHEALLKLVDDTFVANGWPTDEVSFLIMPTYRVSTPDDVDLVAYREAVEDFAGAHPRCSFINLADLFAQTEMDALYNGGDTSVLLNSAAYETLAGRVVENF